MQQILNILGSVGFNWHVALANFINFLIILFILNKFFFGKLGQTISKRREVIEKGIAQASEAEKALARAGEEEKEIIHKAKKEGHVIVSEAQAEALALAETIKQGAEAEATARLKSLAEKEATLKEKVEKEFAEHAPALVAQLWQESLRSNMTMEENNALVAQMK